MKIEFDKKNDVPISIEISRVPNGINIKNETAKECYFNSVTTAKNNTNVEIIEGLGVMISKDKSAKAFAHAWNRLNDLYFDVTINESKKLNEEIMEIKYLKVRSYLVDEFENGDNIEFSKDTLRFVKELNKKFE